MRRLVPLLGATQLARKRIRELTSMPSAFLQVQRTQKEHLKMRISQKLALWQFPNIKDNFIGTSSQLAKPNIVFVCLNLKCR
jgi:hypothetical protein